MTYKLFLDDIRFPPGNAYPAEPNEWIIARNMDDAAWYIKYHGIPYFISFDHDLADEHYGLYDSAEVSKAEKTGYDFAKWFCKYVIDNEIALPDNFDYYVHSMNPVGKANIEQYMRNFVITWRKK